jgi:hypothetical protein
MTTPGWDAFVTTMRDWIELRLHSPADLGRLTGLLVIAAAENT